MTKSRKLFVAAALLAGGYGVACFLDGTPDKLGPNGGSPSSATEEGGIFSALGKFTPGRGATAPTGQLVPEDSAVTRVSADPMALVPQQAPLQPTWLVATTPAREALPRIEPPKYADAPALAESHPIAVAEPQVTESNTSPAAPKARITNVVSTTASEQAASPWDRWPWWNSNVRPTVSASGSRASLGNASLNQAPETERSAATPASFTISEPVRAVEETFTSESSAGFASGRTHVVVDGDSLAKLADRYLDDAALGEEIYRLNKDILRDPELLPIGVELRIPENRVADATQRLAGAIGMQGANSGPPPGMVPVDWKPRPFDSEPRAQLLRPVPAGRND